MDKRRAMRTARMLGFGLLAVTALLPLLGGCQRGSAPLTPVSGKVAYKGFSLQGGTIVFTPDAARGESGRLALGKINQDGSYQLYTGEALGAPAGWYRVTITSLAPSGVQAPGQVFNPPYSLLPEKYRDPDLSELACEIKADRPNKIDFDLN
jgi:hypothetical protein